MGLSRLVVVALLVWVAWSLWRRWRRAGKRGSTQVNHGGRIVKCGECGVYLPETEARALGTAGFVCRSHDHPPH